MNSSQVRAKARAAMGRREDEVEEEEIQGGEINLIPYLDIVTNLMLFLLASITSGFILGQINTTLPDHATASSKPAVDPAQKPDEQPLQLMVSVTKNRLILWSVSGLEGSLQEPKVTAGLLPPQKASDAPTFDYQKLNQALIEIATRRWKGKLRPNNTYEILLQADGDIPYETVIAVMDHMRRPLPADPAAPLPVLSMPKFEIKDGKEQPTEPYDPEKHLLFVDVLFAKPSFD
jgi:biopolymer transport protein TolR